jgi:hypothetical protein
MLIWKSLARVDLNEAIKSFSSNKDVYLLNDADDTGIIAFSLDQIHSHASIDRTLGVEPCIDSGAQYTICNCCGNKVFLNEDYSSAIKDYAIKV